MHQFNFIKKLVEDEKRGFQNLVIDAQVRHKKLDDSVNCIQGEV